MKRVESYQMLFCVDLNDHAVFIFHSVNVMCHINWLAPVELSSEPRDQPPWDIMCQAFNVLGIQFSGILMNNFVSLFTGNIGL